MPQLTLSIQYQKNTGLVLNSTELKNLYFTGIELKDQYGNPIPEETINFYIEAAQKELADYLSIKLFPTCYSEDRDYVYDDWMQWGYVPTTYPVVKPIRLQGFLNTSLQIDYPKEWMSAKKQSPDEDLYHRSISLVPVTGGAAAVSGQPYFLQTPYSSIYGTKIIPNYWKIQFLTGFYKVPADILRAIGIFASISLFINLSDIINGAPGLAGKSIGIDGLSQSVTSTASAGKLAFAGRIDAYRKELKDTLLPNLKSRYCGFHFGTL